MTPLEPMHLAVAGGTGVVGRHVVAVARERGHAVDVLSRSTGADLRTGLDLMSGDVLADRLAGADAVVDVTSVATQRRAGAEAFFGAITRQLQAAGVRHLVALSIVGVDGIDNGYYAGKRLQERLLADGPVPWTVLRATQFHEFAEQVLGFARIGPLSLVPRMRTQTVAAREVAEALVDLAEQGPKGRVPDLAGPEVHDLVDLARRVAYGRRVVPLRVPGAGGRAMRSGGLLPVTAGPRGVITFDAWLAAR